MIDPCSFPTDHPAYSDPEHCPVHASKIDQETPPQAHGAPIQGEPVEPTPPVLAGTFAIYQTGDGGLCLVTEMQDRGIERRVISGKVLKFMRGPGAKMLGKMFGGELDGNGGSVVE